MAKMIYLKGLERGSRPIFTVTTARHLIRKGRPGDLIYSYLLVHILARS